MSEINPVEINASDPGLLCRQEADLFICDNLGRTVGLLQTCQRYATRRQKVADNLLFTKLRKVEESIRSLEDHLTDRMKRRKNNHLG